MEIKTLSSAIVLSCLLVTGPAILAMEDEQETTNTNTLVVLAPRADTAEITSAVVTQQLDTPSSVTEEKDTGTEVSASGIPSDNDTQSQKPTSYVGILNLWGYFQPSEAEITIPTIVASAGEAVTPPQQQEEASTSQVVAQPLETEVTPDSTNNLILPPLDEINLKTEENSSASPKLLSSEETWTWYEYFFGKPKSTETPSSTSTTTQVSSPIEEENNPAIKAQQLSSDLSASIILSVGRLKAELGDDTEGQRKLQDISELLKTKENSKK